MKRINDKADSSPRNNQFSGNLVETDKNAESYGINAQTLVSFKVDYRQLINYTPSIYHADLSVLGSIYSTLAYFDPNTYAYYSQAISCQLYFLAI